MIEPEDLIRKVARLSAWILLAYIVFVTLGPVSDRPQLGHPNAERFFAFAVVGAAFAFGYPRNWRAVASGMIVLAGILEAAQNLIPQRDAHIADFAFKAAGGLLGAALGLVASFIVSWVIRDA